MPLTFEEWAGDRCPQSIFSVPYQALRLWRRACSRGPHSGSTEATQRPIRLPTEARFCLQSATPPTLPSSFVASCVQGCNVQKPDLFWFLALLFPRVHAERKLIAVRHTHGSKQTNNQQTNENYSWRWKWLWMTLWCISHLCLFENQVQSRLTDCPYGWCDCEARFMARWSCWMNKSIDLCLI